MSKVATERRIEEQMDTATASLRVLADELRISHEMGEITDKEYNRRQCKIGKDILNVKIRTVLERRARKA